MLKFVDLTFQANTEYPDPQSLIGAQWHSLGYIDHLKEWLSPVVIKHIDNERFQFRNDSYYRFFRSKNRFGYIPFQTLKYMKAVRPDIVLVQGLIFPIQVMALRLALGSRCKVIVQHHGEHPSGHLKKWLQQMANRYINAYLFTAKDNATEWINAGIIRGYDHCHEVTEASTLLERSNKTEARIKTGMSGQPNCLWVGRLTSNKDPLTVLQAFEKFIRLHPEARLYMIFQTEELLPEVKKKIQSSPFLQSAVFLKGKIAREQLSYWFSAADCFISGSHSEGSGYALMEAMSCGCTPVVTDIPSFRKITGNGQYGFLFPPGDADQLAKKLGELVHTATAEKSELIEAYCKAQLDFRSIALRIYAICQSLSEK